MFKTITKIFILCLTIVSSAQEVEVVDGLLNPLNLAVHNDELYICDHSGNNIGQGTISKIDLTEENPVVVDLVTGLIYPRAIGLYGNDLYFSNGTISKFDITETNPVVEDIMYVSSTYALIEIDDFLYIAGDNSISKIDLTSSNPSLINVVSLPVRPLAFTYRDGFLYFGYGTKVAKIDPTQTNPVPEIVMENLESNIYSLIFYEDKLLIGMSLISKISMVDFSQDPLVLEDFMDTETGRPTAFAIHNDDLYVAGGIGNNIFKIEGLSMLLSVEEVQPFIALSIYPNPSSENIKILGINRKYNFEIFDLNGQLVLKGQRDEAIQNINIDNLSSGLYHIKISDNTSKAHVLKFIKH